MKTKLQWAVLFCLLSIISLLSTGCPTTNNTDAEEEEQLGTGGGPVITAQPMGGFYNAGDAIDPLVIAAESPDNGTLTYQWYKADSPGSNGAEVAGATDATYQPTDTAVGKTFYYCVVTNTSALTQATRKSAVAKIFILAEGSTFSANTTVTVDTTRNQYVRGFGGMYVVWTNFPDLTLQNMRTMFDPDGELGYNMLRIMIPPINTDIDQAMEDIINRVEYSSDTVDNSDYYDLVKYVNSKNGYVLASPWSPPKEWKSGGTINGGESLIAAYYGDYAEYLKKFCQNMFTHGAPLYAISIQNEPNYRAAYDGCDWTDNEMRDFFKTFGHFTDGVSGYGGGKSIPSVLTMNGESANIPTINNAALSDPVSRAAIDIIGRHVYGYQQNNYWGGNVVNKEKEVWMTEHNINSGNATSYPNDSTWNYVWKLMNDIDGSIRVNNESAFIWWALKRFYSMVGDGQYGTVENAILPRGYGLAHYAKVANETWRVNVTVTGTSNVNNASFNVDNTAAVVTAFESDDKNSISLVIFTPTTTTGTGGVDLGLVKIQLPETFTVGSATAIRSNASAQGKSETVLLDKSKTAVYVEVPRSNIVSVKLTK
jgi:O-glycosyl hydrolase